MKINKWNYMTRQYDEVTLPDLNYKTYSNDMKEIVNCPHCFKEVTHAETYTSMEFHTEFGMGYGVCDECYQKEWQRRKDWEMKQ